MKRQNHIYSNRLTSSNAVDALDVRLVACGLGEHVETWPINPAYSSESFFRIYLPLEGAFRITSPGGELEVSRGKLCLVPALTPLRYRGISPSRHYWCHFFSRYLETVLERERMYEVHCRSVAKYERLFLQLIRTLSERDTIQTSMKLRHQLDQLLLPFLESEPCVAERAMSADVEIQRAVDYIENHLREPIRLEKLLKLTNMSESTFRRRFSARQGVCRPKITSWFGGCPPPG